MDPFVNDNHVQSRPSRFRSAIRRMAAPVKKHAMCHSPGDNVVLSTAWILSSVLTVLVPLIYRTIHKNRYRQEYMKYYWEQEYEQYVSQRQQNYEKYGNSYNYGGAYMANYQESEYIDVNQCKWWQLNCFSFFVNKEGEPMPDQEWQPAWYSGFSVSEEERQQMQDNLEQPGSLKFVYIWQIIMFAVLASYGLLVIRQNRNPSGLIIALLVWSNFAFLSMWLMADGSIVTEGQQVKRTGFYGQMSVLIFMSNFWYFLHGFAFVLVFWMRSTFREEKEESEKAKEVQSSEGLAVTY